MNKLFLLVSFGILTTRTIVYTDTCIDVNKNKGSFGAALKAFILKGDSSGKGIHYIRWSKHIAHLAITCLPSFPKYTS